jgi:tRNA (guanine37-N1)-methyltransferase
MNGENLEQKVMYFDPDLVANKEDARQQIQETVKTVADIDVSLNYKKFDFTYKDWDVRRCLKAILPENLEFRFDFFVIFQLTSFFSGHTQAGHILHLNLREETMPYKYVIGRILLDKISYAR